MNERFVALSAHFPDMKTIVARAWGREQKTHLQTSQTISLGGMIS